MQMLCGRSLAPLEMLSAPWHIVGMRMRRPLDDDDWISIEPGNPRSGPLDPLFDLLGATKPLTLIAFACGLIALVAGIAEMLR